MIKATVRVEAKQTRVVLKGVTTVEQKVRTQSQKWNDFIQNNNDDFKGL